MEVQRSSSHSQISACSSAYARKAWHIVSILRSLGRPACSAELAEKFTFIGMSREIVEFLCWIPNSPLLLTNDGIITLSPVALVSLGQFVARSMLRVKVGGWKVPKSLGENVIGTYCRKRKSLGEVVNPSLKKKRPDSRLLGEGKAEDGVPDFVWVVSRNLFQGSKHVYLEYCIHQVRKVEQLKEHPFLVQPSSLSSPRPDSLLLEETCMEDCMSNIANNAFEDCGDVEMELERGRAAIKRNIKNLSSSSDSIKKAASFRKDLDKESMNDSKNKTVAQVYQKKSPFEAIKDQQDVLDPRLEGLFQQIEQIDVLPKRKHLKGPNESHPKDKTNRIPKSDISNQEGSGSFCLKSSKNLQRKSAAKTIHYQQDLAQNLEELSEEQVDDDILKIKCRTIPKSNISIKNKTKQIPKSNISTQEKNGSFCISSPNPKDHFDSKEMPRFDLYTVEEEEGSGGYGTVYRARRKSDGVKFAIKYPRPNANKYHIDNERRMLERFGGKDFIIRYEGSCRSENSDCFILKHVEHDRTDVLKKEIDISELQWYGYCMFTALRSLHKQGVVHRDVKPGNFLFSRKTCVGFMIDFNLAKDLHPKQASTGIYPNSHHKTVSTSKRRKILDTKAPELASVTLKRGPKIVESKVLRNKALDANHRNSIASQGADGSVLTSAKDLTTTKTPSAERLREPLPYQGRKELINLAQEAMQIPDQKVAGVPSNKRKRIDAPSAVMGRELVYSTPMPIHSSGIAAPGSGFLKEGGKKQKEGSCSGTKGYRAPEVLLRSVHQGAKLDVWSAGVTLLYLMTGKMPFTGEPEQNMKDIVKLRGSEELWELAKLHDRESSFPKELYDVHCLQSMELRNWCKANTKRPEFVKTIPSSLFDLVDKCLTVNPRVRISAEEALRHEFLAPCVDAIKRRRRFLKQES